MSTSTTRKRVVLYQHQPISSQSHSLARRACKIALEAVSKQLTRSVSEGGGKSRVESPSLTLRVVFEIASSPSASCSGLIPAPAE